MLIPTRVHGAIDYAVASLFGALATSRALTPEVRRVLGGAGAVHAGYAALTDYETGVAPVLSMRQHLALDALGGASLCAAGLLLRQQSPGMRGLLLAAGAAELAVVALSSPDPVSGPGQGSGPVGRLLAPAGADADGATRATYPPLDTPKPVAEGVWIVDSRMPGTMGLVLPVRMTVIRLADGGLLLHSPTRFSIPLKQALERLGPIRHLVAPNVAHWVFLRDWQRACPDATTWAAPGLRQRAQVRRSRVRVDRELGERAPAEWGGGFALQVVPGGLGFREVALFHEPTRTLVLTDLVINLEAPKVLLPLRPLLRLFGMLAPDGMPPPYLREVVKLRRREAEEAARRLVAFAPERVIFAHGSWFERNGAAALHRSLRWLLR